MKFYALPSTSPKSEHFSYKARHMNPQPRILVMGAGGLGGIVAATLTEVGSADTSGYRVIDEGEERVVRGWVSPEPEGHYDLCILATQPPNVEDAARTALPH